MDNYVDPPPECFLVPLLRNKLLELFLRNRIFLNNWVQVRITLYIIEYTCWFYFQGGEGQDSFPGGCILSGGGGGRSIEMLQLIFQIIGILDCNKLKHNIPFLIGLPLNIGQYYYHWNVTMDYLIVNFLNQKFEIIFWYKMFQTVKF